VVAVGLSNGGKRLRRSSYRPSGIFGEVRVDVADGLWPAAGRRGLEARLMASAASLAPVASGGYSGSYVQCRLVGPGVDDPQQVNGRVRVLHARAQPRHAEPFGPGSPLPPEVLLPCTDIDSAIASAEARLA